MSRLRFAAPAAGFLALRSRDTRECWMSFYPSKPWTVGASYIRYMTAEPRRTVHFFMLWMFVDKWIKCGLPRGIQQGVEDLSRQKRAPRNESGEVPARRRARLERPESLVRGIDASRGDDLDAVAEFLTQALHVFERVREKRGPRESSGLLREARLLYAARVAAVDDRDARVTRRGDRRLLVGPAKIRRHLDDDRLVRRLSHGAEEARQLLRPLRPRVDELGIGRGDVDLHQIPEGRESLHHGDIVRRRLARRGDDERDAVRKRRQRDAIGLEAGIVKPVAVDKPGPLHRGHAHEVRLRMPWARFRRDALGGDGAEPEPHGSSEYGRIVVHGGQDQWVR